MSQSLHTISGITLNNTFLDLYLRVNDIISVVNQIKVYDVQATGGIIHKRQVVPSTQEVFQLNLATTGGHGYGLGIISLSDPSSVGAEWEGATFALRLNYQNLQSTSSFLGSSGATVHVADDDFITIGASGSRGDDVFRPLKVFAKDSLPYNIDGKHRFRGDVFFDGSQVVINSAQLHIDDRLLFLASAGNTDDPGVTAGLTSNAVLSGGSGSGFVIKGLSGDKYFVYHSSDGGTGYYSFLLSENFETAKSFVSPNGGFKFIGVSGSAPYISLRTAGQDSPTLPIGWKIYQSITGGSIGSLKMIREGITDFDSLELFPNSEVKIGAIASGTAGDGSFRTEATKFSIPGTREKQVLHYSWQNRDVVRVQATADGGLFSESISAFKPGTVLTFNELGQYKRARWDADPFTGYKDAEVIGIVEKITSDDYILQVPVRSNVGATYTTSLFSLNENVSIKGNGFTVKGYVYENLPANGISGIKIFVDNFPSGITVGSFVKNTGSIFVGGATLFGSADNDFIGISASQGITVTSVDYAVIVRQGVFEIPETGTGATGYDQIQSLGLTAGYLFYLGGTARGQDSACYGGVTFSPSNLFDPELFYNSGANVAKPVFIYMGIVDGKRMGLFQAYQGLGLTYAITSSEQQPVYYDTVTSEITNFDALGEVSGRNKIMNSGFDVWTRLDAHGVSYAAYDTDYTRGITFRSTIRSNYPFGSTYSGNPADYQNNILISGYVADGYFFDTSGKRARTVFVKRQPVSATLPTMVSPPNNELVIKQVGGNGTANARLYAIVPDHRTLANHDFNFSFYARTDSGTNIGITVGVPFVWNSGSTYAIIESKHAFLASGAGTSGGTAYAVTLGNTYQRYNFAFSSQGIAYSGATGTKGSFVAPYIELGSITDLNSLYITGLQLSKGISPKPYEKKSPAIEKLDCGRYFQNIIVANGGYYPIFTGQSGPKLFAGVNLQNAFVETPVAKKAIDMTLSGLLGASADADPHRISTDSFSVFRTTNDVSSTYHRYFETVYSLDASGFSGTVNSRLLGMT
jgi:hypothetical protein